MFDLEWLCCVLSAGWQTEVNVLSRVVVVEGATQPREKGLLSQVIKRFQVG